MRYFANRGNALTETPSQPTTLEPTHKTTAWLQSAGYARTRYTRHTYVETRIVDGKSEFVFECSETGARRVMD